MNPIDYNAHKALFQRNLAYLQQRYPAVYRYYMRTHPSHLQRCALVSNGRTSIDLLENGVSRYDGDARRYAEKEVAQFIQAHPEGMPLQWTAMPKVSCYGVPRFFGATASSLFKQIPEDVATAMDDATLPDFFPSVVILGVGLGFHIEALLLRRRVLNLYIIEPDPEVFYASLWTMDWSSILGQFDEVAGYNVDFIIGESSDVSATWVVLWNYLVRQAPLFPVATLFYSHYAYQQHAQLIQRARRDMPAFVASWGNYDDEVNQLRQALYNQRIDHDSQAKQAHRFSLPKRENESLQFDRDRPICVIGSGPSLDRRIDQLRAMQPFATLISCGSAISVLFAHGIVPDIHCELEADYQLTVATYEAIPDKAYLQSITLVAPLQVSPHVLPFFKQTLFFLRQGGTVGTLWQQWLPTLGYGEPTCTNLGVALALYYGCQRILLWGMDLGFHDVAHHHSKASVYFDENADPALAAANERVTQQLFEVPSVEGATVWTRSDYYYAKWRLECAINAYAKKGSGAVVYNISEGATIEGTRFLSFEQMSEQMSAWTKAPMSARDPSHKAVDLKGCLLAAAQPLDSLPASEVSLSEVALQVGKACRDMRRLLSSPIESVEQYVLRTNQVNRYLRLELREWAPAMVPLLAGSCHHLLFIGLSFVLGWPRESQSSESQLSELKSKPLCAAFIERWRDHCTEFLVRLPQHFSKSTQLSCSVEADESLRLSIVEATSIDREMNNECQ